MRKRNQIETALGSTFVAEAVHGDRRIVRYLDARAGVTGAPCFIALRYEARDPLVVGVSLCAPSRAAVLERTTMRSDVRDSLQRRIYDIALVMTPDVLRGQTLFRFREPTMSVTAMVPSRAVAEFIRDTDDLVPFGFGEVDALNAAFTHVLAAERLSHGGA